MKRVLNGICVTAIAFLMPLSMFAADTNTTEQKIQLPDVTTVVTGDSLTAGKNAIPDFSDVTPSTDEATTPLPQLPDAKSDNVKEEPEADLSYGSERNLYAEGLIGCGFPGYFSGDFSIYKSSGDNPFKLRFYHESANDYGTHTAAKGFFTGTTELSGTKKFTLKNVILNIGATYNTGVNGMQNLSTCFFDDTKQTVSSQNNVTWMLPLNFSITLQADGSYYSRYAGLTNNGSAVAFSYQESGAKVMTVLPQVSVAWNNLTADDTGLQFDLYIKSAVESFLSEMEFATTEEPTTSLINREQFGLNGSWNNKTLSVKGNAGIVIGNALGAVSVTAPFSLEIDARWMNAASSRPVTLSAIGGLDSYLPMYGQLEKTYSFTSQQYLESETSDWFAKIETSLPIASRFTFNASAVWRMTAFGNGIWEPVYSEQPLASGLYAFSQIDRTLFASNIGFSFLWKLLTLSVDWKSNWLYVPVTENAYAINATCSVQAEDGFWGSDVTLQEALGDGVDMMPNISAGAFVRMNNTLRLAGEINDMVKLFSGTDRTYANSKYISRAGSVTVLVKFFF